MVVVLTEIGMATINVAQHADWYSQQMQQEQGIVM